VSLPSSSNQGPLFRKPRADVYTALLVIALLALILGSVVLYFEANPKEYGENPWSGAPSVSIEPIGGGLCMVPLPQLEPQGSELETRACLTT